MAVPKRDIAAAVLAIAEAWEAYPGLPYFSVAPSQHEWVLDKRYAAHYKDIFAFSNKVWHLNPDWRTAFDAGIGRWLPVVDSTDVSQ